MKDTNDGKGAKTMKGTEEHFKFLDQLRESGETNMFGAAPYLIAEFDMSRSESHEVLAQWMETFNERHKVA